MTLWNDLLGCSVSYREAGPVRTRMIEAGRGQRVILLHGMGGHAEAFARNLVPLQHTGRLSAIDMLGHGLTSKPTGPFGLRELMDHVDSLLQDSERSDGVILVGISLGGLVASHLARENPEVVRGLVLISGAGLSLGTAPETRRVNDEVSRITQDVLSDASVEGTARRLQWLFAKPESMTDELLQLRHHLYNMEGARAALEALHQRIMGEDVHRYRLDEAALRGIRCPTLFAWGEHNPTTTWLEAEAASGVVDDGRFLLFRESAHWANWEEPGRFNEQFEKFLLDCRS